MKSRISQFLAILLASATLAGCAAVPEKSRPGASVQAPRAGAVTALQRKFQAQARNIVYFGFNRDTLDAEARARLNEQAVWILQNDNLRFRVYGHTDKVGGDGYNYALGLRRANRVVDYLVSKGVSRGRLEAMVSNGEESPAVNTEDREKLNRRVVTEVFGFIRGGETERSASLGGSRTPTGTPASGSDTSQVSDDTPSGGSGSTGGTSSNGGGTKGNSKTDKNPNSGRGNGDEAGDPGKSGGKNNGGDEA